MPLDRDQPANSEGEKIAPLWERPQTNSARQDAMDAKLAALRNPPFLQKLKNLFGRYFNEK